MRRVFSYACGSILLAVLGGGCSGMSAHESRIELGSWSSQHRLMAWGDRAIMIAPQPAGTHNVRAYSADEELEWSRDLDCTSSDIVRDGLLCVGQKGLTALSGGDGGNLWTWKSPWPIRSIQYEGVRVTVGDKTGERFTVNTANGHAVAPGPIDANLFTSSGALSVATDGRVLRAHRAGNGKLQWRVLTALWPSHRVLLHHLLVHGKEPGGGHFLGLVNSESRLLLQRSRAPKGESILAVHDTPNGVLVVQDTSVTGLRAQNVQTLPRSESVQAWALGQTSIMSVEAAGKAYELVWRFAGPMQTSSVPPWRENEKLLSQPGVTFHGAWLDESNELMHVEVRVKRWSPDLLYAWRTTGPWTARRGSPEADGDRGLNPAFDGAQPFSPMPLWFSPTMVDELMATGIAQVGKLALTRVGWSYHQLVMQVGQGEAEHRVALPVMVVARADNGDRYWISPNGANPLLLRAERENAIFYLAGMSVPADLRR